MSGMCLPPEISVRSESMETSESSEVSVGREWSNVEVHGATFMVKKRPFVAGLDSEVFALWKYGCQGTAHRLGNTQVHVPQQKEGRCETSRSMLGPLGVWPH